MSERRLTIVYEKSNLVFEGNSAKVVENAIFEAESKGAKACRVEVLGREYWISTRNYLYRFTERTHNTLKDNL